MAHIKCMWYRKCKTNKHYIKCLRDNSMRSYSCPCRHQTTWLEAFLKLFKRS